MHRALPEFLSRKHKVGFSVAVAIALLNVSLPAAATSLQRVASGLASPLFATHAPADLLRLFILEKNSGQVKILNLSSGAINAQPFLSAQNITTNGERGLLGLAFHPQYSSNREIYVYVTNTNGDSELRRYQGTGNPDQANSGVFDIILQISQPASNHNGGWIGFGPDGFLYVAVGDGGGGNDPDENGQDRTTLLGNMLRIDVDGDDFPADAQRNYRIPGDNPFVGLSLDGEPAKEEIWAYGLRNPWRASFDRQTGDLWIADVGQGAREEVNFQLGSSAGGENYGWRLREGKIATPSVGGARPQDNVDPIYDYTRGTSEFQGFSVTGGYRYRGPVLAARNNYFFGDFLTAQIWSIKPNGASFSDLINWTNILQPDVGQVNNIASFGEDAAGNLYVVDFDGDIFKLVGATGSGNGNGASAIPAVNLLLSEEEE